MAMACCKLHPNEKLQNFKIDNTNYWRTHYNRISTQYNSDFHACEHCTGVQKKTLWRQRLLRTSHSRQKLRRQRLSICQHHTRVWVMRAALAKVVCRLQTYSGSTSYIYICTQEIYKNTSENNCMIINGQSRTHRSSNCGDTHQLDLKSLRFVAGKVCGWYTMCTHRKPSNCATQMCGLRKGTC